MNLLIDIGNTSIHWRLSGGLESASPTISVRHQHDWESTLETLDSTLGDYQVEQIVIASVVGEAARESVEQWIKRRFDMTPIFVQSQKNYSGVTNAYENPEQLGVDRWLAVLAGHTIITKEKFDAALIVDAGTAMTIDALLADGTHLGGNIIAGLQLQQESLLQNTSEIEASQGEASIWGANTASAVANGAYLALAGAIIVAHQQLSLSLEQGQRIHLLLSGGDAEILEHYFSQATDIQYSVHSNLVLDGLEVYLAR